jgi:hypothetical protein
MNNRQDKNCKTADEFIEFFRSHRLFKTTNIFQAATWGLNGYIFRGQSDSSWPLIASAFRDNTLKDFTPQTTGGPLEDDAYDMVYLGMQLHSEIRAVLIFLESADRLGITTPLDYPNLYAHSQLVNGIFREDIQYLNTPFPSAKLLNSMALAQHHGVPTRLMDWTESPMIAAFFAAYEASTLIPEDRRIKSDKIAVIFLRRTLASEDYSELSIINSPRHQNSFLRNQKGMFTHIPNANRFFIENKRWPSVEEIVAQTQGFSIGKVTLPSLEATNLLRILYDQDITRHSLMPSLDNAAKALKYKKLLFKQT